MVKVGRMSYLFENINKGALTAGNKINGYSSKLHWPWTCCWSRRAIYRIDQIRTKEREGRVPHLGWRDPSPKSKQLNLGRAGAAAAERQLWPGSPSTCGDEEGRVGKLLVLPGEPQLVTAIPRQGVQVGEEDGLLHVLPEEWVQCGEGWLVSGVDVSSWTHFNAIQSACVVCYVCEKCCVFLSFFTVALVNVCGQGHSEFNWEILIHFTLDRKGDVHLDQIRQEDCKPLKKSRA